MAPGYPWFAPHHHDLDLVSNDRDPSGMFHFSVFSVFKAWWLIALFLVLCIFTETVLHLLYSIYFLSLSLATNYVHIKWYFVLSKFFFKHNYDILLVDVVLGCCTI